MANTGPLDRIVRSVLGAGRGRWSHPVPRYDVPPVQPHHHRAAVPIGNVPGTDQLGANPGLDARQPCRSTRGELKEAM
jgi:hypothetical protein